MNSSLESTEQKLRSEIIKLRRALSLLIPWAGKAASGPEWATDEAKVRNRGACEKAIEEACDCFPPDYNAIDEMTRSN
jgi:hypothetical protein